jgi:DUF2958 family protein
MKLITDSLTEQLLANGRAQRAAIDKNGRSRFEQTLGWPAGQTLRERTRDGSEYNDQPALDFKPVVKLFTPDAQCTWLLTELDPDERATLWRAPIQDVSAGPRTQQDCEASGLTFGLCDLGLGCPELGDVSLAELSTVRGKLGLPVERDRHFEADKTISAYAEEARQLRRIVA